MAEAPIAAMKAVADRQVRSDYTWHLRQPFSAEFDAAHWWKPESLTKLDAVGALYELARRHPRVGATRSRFRSSIWHGCELRPRLSGDAMERLISAAYEDLGSGPRAIHCLCLIGLKPWPKLDWRDQEFWEMSVGKKKGVDCRDSTEQCVSLTSAALSTLIGRRMMKLNPPKGSMTFSVEGGRGSGPRKVAPVDSALHQAAQDRLADDLRRNPIKESEIEAEIARLAVAAHRSGSFVLSVRPDLAHDHAAAVLTQIYQHDFRSLGSDRQRARWMDWLPAIADFEDDEMTKNGSKAAVFTRYRRMIDSLDFEENQRSPTTKITRGH